MRFRHKMTGKNTMKRVFSFLLMLCLLVPMLPSSIGLEAKADDTTDTTTGDGNTVTITLHDLYIDRKEALPDGTDLVELETQAQGQDVTQDKACLLAYKYARSVTVKKGTTLEQAFEQFKNDENLQLGTFSLAETKVYKPGTEDKTAMTSTAKASECVWYTRGVDKESHSGGVDGNNPRDKFDSDTAITEDIDLYTYSYRLRLVTGKQEYKDLIVREGQTEGFIAGNRDEKKSISEFLKDVDSTWTDVNLGTKLTDATQFNNGITQNYILRKEAQSANTTKLTYYAAVDGEWKEVKKDTAFDLDRVDVWGRTGPALNYYVTDDELKSVYSEYGFGKDVTFEGKEITKQKNGYFPYGTDSNNDLHIRQMPKYETVNGATQFRVPLIEDTGDTKGLAVYYTPHNTTEYESRFLDGTPGRNGSVKKSDSAVLRDNSFYTVSVDDADMAQFDDSTTLPNKNTYYLYGSGATVTLPLKDKDGAPVKWYVEKGGDNVTIDEATGNVTVEAIDRQLVLTTDASKEYADDVQVHCFVLVNGEPKEIGKLHTHATQKYDAWGSGENQTRYYVTAEQAEKVFREFGFKSSEFDPDTNDSQKYIFANTTYGKNNSNKIWTDAVPAKFNDVYKIPLAKSAEFNGVSGSKDLSLYYVPKNTTNGGIAVTADTLKTSTFYSISTDVGDTKFSNLPKTKYVLNGMSTTIDLPSKDDSGNAVTWYPEKGSDILTIVKKDGDTVTVSITNIDKEVVLTTDANKQDADAIKVHCYILVDGQPVEVGLVTTKKSQAGWGTNPKDKGYTRYYVTAKQVESIYKTYGFDASQFDPDKNDSQKYIFANAITQEVDQWNNPNRIWTDTAARSFNNEQGVQIPLVNTSDGEDTKYKNVDLYYIPNNQNSTGTAQGGGIYIKGNNADQTFIKNNTFYSIKVEDQSGKFSPDDIPKTRYGLSGKDVKVTVPSMDGVEWYIKDASTEKENYVILTPNGTTTTVSVPSISHAITLTTKSEEKSSNHILLHCYVVVDEKEVEAGTVYFSTSQNAQLSPWKNYRYFISTQILEKVYTDYNFKASEYKGELYFPVTVHDDNVPHNKRTIIWADTPAIQYDGSAYYRIPLTSTNGTNNDPNEIEGKKNVDLFYTPNGINANSADRNSDVVCKDNTFYSITANDEANQFPGVTLPDTQYALTGTDKTITLPYKDGVNWYIESEGSTKKITPTTVSDDKTTATYATYTLENVTKAINLTTDGLADDEVAVSGYISVNGEWKRVSSTLQKISTDQTDTSSGRYYLTSDDLEKLFGSYGFKAEEYKDTDATELSKYFPSSTIGAETISTNAGGKKKDDGSWWVNTIETKDRETGIAVYYVPNIKHVTRDSFAKTNTDVLTDNQFYIISFEDSTGLANVPSTMYLRGGQVTITVPYKDDVTWTVLGKQKNDSNSKDAALYVKQKVSTDGDSAELTFNLHSNVTVTTKTVTRNEIKLEAYVSLNGTWTLLKDTGISRANWYEEKTQKYYITEQELLDIYQAYGFTGLKDGEYHIAVTTLYNKDGKKFDNTRRQTDWMWADQTLKTDAAGNRFLPLITNDYDKNCVDDDDDKGKANVIRLYYVPNNTSTDGLKTANDETPAKENAFYSITFKDPENKFQPSELPKDQLLLSGKSTELTLPYKKDVTWIVTDKDGSLIRLDQTTDEKTVTIKIPAINQPLIVTTGKATSETLAPDKIAVNAYVAIDDAWVSVGTAWKYTDNKFVGDANSFTVADTQTTIYTTKDSKGKTIEQTRYYLTVDQLQNIFGTYGFKASSFTDTDTNNRNIFPHTTINFPAANIYADIPTQKIGGTWCVLFTNKATDGDKGISIYYTPTRSDNRSFWGPNNTNLLRDNSVRYTVSAKDRLGVLPSGADIAYPKAVQVERSESATYNLPSLPAGYHWTAVNKNTGKPLTKATVEQSTDNPLEYTVSNILEPVQFIVWKYGEKRLIYDAQVTPEKLTDTSTFAQPEKQEIVIDGSIEKKATKSISYENKFNGNDTILPTDSERAQVTLTESSHPRTFYYTFQGWQVDGTDTILQPGQPLSKLDNYDSYELISLTAVWKAVDENSRPATVNFYVSLECEIMDNASNGVSGRDKGSFTESVYATRIYGTDAMNKVSQWEDNKNSMFSIIASDSDSTAYGVDATLRKMTDVPIYTSAEQGTNGTTPVPLTLESFPTDEEVLANLRDTNGWSSEVVKKMKLDGKEIKKEDLTTDNFAVRWYVLKYQSADAWHIDGVLVAKEAHAVVTKTFAGNQTAIEKVKENGYSISVTHEQPVEAISETGETEAATQDVTTDYTLVLQSKDSVKDDPERGYDSYDPATDTYTWILTGRQGRAYRVKENNYEAPTDEKDDAGKAKYDGTYRYMIRNCTYADEDENIDNDVWKSYGGDIAEKGIDLVAEAYPTDVPSSAYQTIAFENRYVSAGDFTIQKIDSATQNGLKNVNFTLSRIVNGEEDMNFTLWREGRTSRYYVELPTTSTGEDSSDDDLPKGIDNDNYEQMTNRVVMTDELGYFYIHLPTGTYQLKETAPLGYKGASTITITVDADGKMSKVTTDDDNKWFTLDENGAILTIKNESRLLTTVTALKQWNANTHTDDQKPVTVELWRNGAKMSGPQYTQRLDEKSNNWQYEWKDLPLFIDGAVAKYELREIYIGSTAYDTGADSDGYADYNVSYETAKYCEDENRPNLSDGTVDKSKFTSTTATWKDSTDDDTTHYANHALFVVNNSLAKGYISFQKMDGLNRALPGAEFTLYSDESCSTAVATATSQEDGTVQFASQRAGTYYMKETKAPDGYAIDTTVYTVTVSDIGNVKITKPSDSKDDVSTDTVMRITNVSDRTLTLKKVSSTSGVQPLAGAKFTITRDDDTLGTFTTDEKGETNFGGLRLDDGEYRITETKAPDGYTALGDHIDIVVKDGTVELGRHGEDHDEADWRLTNSGNSYTLTVKNALESNGVLPSTGNFNPSAALAALLGAALMCGASALALWLRKKRRQNTL